MTDLPPPVWLGRELGSPLLAGIPHLDGLGCARFHRGQSAREPHRHRGIEVHYVWRGHYRWTVEGVTHTACAGDAFVTCPWHLHGSPSGAQEPGWYSWAIVVPGRFPPDGPLRLGPWSWLGARLAAEVGRQLAGAHLLPRAGEVGAVMRLLAIEFAQRPAGWRERADALLADLLLVTARAAGSARERSQDPLAARLAAVVRADLSRPWPLPALCREAGQAAATLRRHLVAATGLSPRDFVAAQRIAAAEERLRAGGDLADVAFACGFASQQHLTTRFRLATGYTPGEYRAAWR